MLFWVICGALVILVAGSILAPFWLGRGVAEDDPAAYDMQVYRDQLREVDRDLQRGVIGADDAAQLRTEIGRKVLDADRRMGASGVRAGAAHAVWAVAVLAVILAGVAWIYQRDGAPGMADLPLADRFAAAERSYATRPSQAEAEAAATAANTAAAPDAAQPDADFAALMDQLRATVAQRPDDPEGLALLARNEARLGNLAAARKAQDRLVEVRGDDASAQDLAELAALMVEQAGGLITAEAEALIARALALDPRNPQARYMAGLLHAQNGRPDRTFPIWARLLADGPPDAPWIAPIRATITELAWLAGQPDYQPPEAAMPALPEQATPGLAGPDADQIAAAEDMTPEDRQAMIEGMVQRLESRLATEGGTPEEWARLIGSLVQIGNTDHAAAIWSEAQARFAAYPDALATVKAAAKAAGLTQ